MGETEVGATRPNGPQRGAERLRKGRTLAERRQERRAAILEAGREVFAAKGYLGSKIEDICRAAYVSTRDFYAEFANREALLLALGEDLVRQIYQAITEVEVEPGPQLVRRRTRARISGVLHTLIDDPRVARVALIETVGVSPEIEALRRSTHHLIADWMRTFLEDDLAAEGIGDQRARLLSLGLVGATNELVADWTAQPPEQRCDVDELTDVILDLHMLVLRRPDP